MAFRTDETGPSLARGGKLAPREVQSQIDSVSSRIHDSEGKIEEIQARLEQLAGQVGGASLSGASAPDAPSLVVDGVLYDPAHPIGPKHWIRENYLVLDDSAPGEAIPRIKIRASLPSGYTGELAGTLYLGMVVEHVDGEANPPATTTRSILLTASVSANEAADGVVDIRPPKEEILAGDTVRCLLVGLGNSAGYSETTYGPNDRVLIAGSDPPVPETPYISRIHRNPHHIKVRLTIQGHIDLEEPYNEPQSINYYSKLEVWAREEFLDDGTTPGSGIHPDDGDAVGWYHAKDIGIKGLVKRIRYETKRGIPLHKSIWFGVKRHKGRKLWLAFRYWDSLGRQGPWANVTPTTPDPGGEGLDSDQAPGWPIVNGPYAPGGTTNYFDNAATDPADADPDSVTCSWTAPEDIPGTKGKEASARVRVYFAASQDGTAPGVNGANHRLAFILRDATKRGRIFHGTTPVDPSKTYVDLAFKHSFRVGAQIQILRLALEGNGFRNMQDLSASPITFYAGTASLPSIPPAPTLTLQKRHKTNTVLKVSWSSHSAKDTYRLLEVYTHSHLTSPTYPDDAGANGWLLSKSKDIKAVRNIGTARLEIAHDANEDLDYCLRIVDCYGRPATLNEMTSSNWLYVTPSTAPDSDDVAPVVGTISASSWVDDVPGTPGKECDLEVTIPWTGTANWVKAKVQATLNGATKYLHKRVDFAPALNSSQSVIFRRKFKYGTSLTISGLAGMGTAQSAESSAIGHMVGGGSIPTPAAPAITGVTHTKRATLIDVTLPNDLSAGVLQIFMAPTGTTSNPDTAPTVWRKIKHVEVDDDIRAGRYTITCTINRPSAYRKAFIARLRSVYSNTVFSAWSAISDSGTVPDSDDTPPAIPTLNGSITSTERDLKGTPRVECDLQVPLSCPGCTDVQIQVYDSGTQKVTEKRYKVPTSGQVTAYWKQKYDKGSTLYCRWQGINGDAPSGWSTSEASWSTTPPTVPPGHSVLAGGTLPALPSITNVSLKRARAHVVIFSVWWSPVSATYYEDLHAEIYEDGVWTALKTVKLKRVRGAGKVNYRVNMDSPYDQPLVRFKIEDRFGQESSYSPANGTDSTWWATAASGGVGDPGDNGTGQTAWESSTGLSFSGGVATFSGSGWNGTLATIVPPVGGKIKMDALLSSWGSAVFGLMDSQNSGYLAMLGPSYQCSVVKVASGSPSVLASKTLAFTPSSSDPSPMKLEVHKKKVILFFGTRQEKLTVTETSPYRSTTWKPVFRSYFPGLSSETISTFTISSLHANGHADATTNAGASDLLALYENNNGLIRGEAMEATSGGYSRNLGTFFTTATNDSGNMDVFIHPQRIIPKAAYSTGVNAYSLLESAASVPNGTLRIYRDATIGWKLLVRSDASGTPAWYKIDMNAAGFDGTKSYTPPPPDPPPGGGSCFSLLRTYVMEEGGRLLPMGDVEPGDRILQEGPDGPVFARVLTVHLHEPRQVFVLQGAIRATGEHVLFGYQESGPPYSAGMVTVQASPLGYALWGISAEGTRRPIVLTAKEVGDEEEVGNLTTEMGNYYVFGFQNSGERIGILAHNLKDI